MTENMKAHAIALFLEYMRQQGLSAEDLKQLLRPDVIDGWFAIKRKSKSNGITPQAGKESGE